MADDKSNFTKVIDGHGEVQYLASAPFSALATTAAGTTVVGGDLSGTVSTAVVAKIQGNATSGAVPAVGDSFVWNGSSWAPGGTWTAYTPTFTQAVGLAPTVTAARFSRLGKTMRVNVFLTATVAGTANNSILLGLPTSTDSPGGHLPKVNVAFGLLGTALVSGFTGPVIFAGVSAYFSSGTTSPLAAFRRADTNSSSELGIDPAQAFGVGSILTANLVYEVQ